MSRLLQRIARVGRGVESRWDESDVDRVWRGLVRKRRRRFVRLATLGIVAGTAALATIVVMKRPHPDLPASVAESAGAGSVAANSSAVGSKTGGPGTTRGRPQAPRTLRFADGSQATSFGGDGAMTVAEDSASQVAVNLQHGGASFDVVHRAQRTFSVRAGEVTVTVLGTAFSVERIADRVGVTVTRGAVSVDWRSGTRQLRAGEEGWFPPLVVAPAPVDERQADTAGSAARSKPRAQLGEPKSSVRAPHALASAARSSRGARREGVEAPRPPPVSATDADARAVPASAPPFVLSTSGKSAPPASQPLVESQASRGDEVSAPGSRHGPQPPEDNPGDADAQALLAAADDARLSGHAEEGAALLRRLMREHPADPRASLAAFSLGRLLLGDLDRPREAALAFARARALGPKGPLAEDALAREVEAWSRAGDRGRARARAEQYLRLYPQGRRTQVVRSFDGR